jgi:hypothetical protein
MECDIDNKEAGIWKAIFWTLIAEEYTPLLLRI